MATKVRVEQRARLQDVRDRELLSAIAHLADDEGWCTSAEIVKAYNVQHDRPLQCVGARLSWMKRWGLVERSHGDVGSGSRWRLSKRGSHLQNGHIDKTLEAQMKAMGEPEMLDLTSAIARRRQSSTREAAIVANREWRYWYARDPKRIR